MNLKDSSMTVENNSMAYEAARKIAEGLPLPTLVRAYSEEENAYFRAGKEPVTSSYLISSSKFLNNPVFRDAWCQQALRRFGPDLATTYDLPALFNAISQVTDLRDFQAAVIYEKSINPEFRDWIDGRKLAFAAEEEMKNCAPGTLGNAIYTFMTQPGIDIEFAHPGIRELTNDVDFIQKQRGLLHDIQHLITGYTTFNIGEHGLALLDTVTCSKYFSPQLSHHLNLSSTFIVTSSLMRNALHYPASMQYFYAVTQHAIETGLALKKPLFMLDVTRYYDWKLDDLREELGFKPFDGSDDARVDTLSLG